MTTRPGSAPSSSKIRSWARPTSDRTAWVVIARPVRRAARRSRPMHPLLGRRDPRLVRPDLADDPGPDPAVPHPALDLGDQLVGEVVCRPAIDEGLRRVVGRAVPAAAHHEVEPARLGQAAQPGRVATDARQGQVHEAPPAGRAEPRELVEDHRLVAGQLPVVPARLDVPQRDLRVLVRQGEPEVGRVDRAEDGLDVGHGRRCYAVGSGSGTFGCDARAAASRSSTMAPARRSRSAGR